MIQMMEKGSTDLGPSFLQCCLNCKNLVDRYTSSPILNSFQGTFFLSVCLFCASLVTSSTLWTTSKVFCRVLISQRCILRGLLREFWHGYEIHTGSYPKWGKTGAAVYSYCMLFQWKVEAQPNCLADSSYNTGGIAPVWHLYICKLHSFVDDGWS